MAARLGNCDTTGRDRRTSVCVDRSVRQPRPSRLATSLCLVRGTLGRRGIGIWKSNAAVFSVRNRHYPRRINGDTVPSMALRLPATRSFVTQGAVLVVSAALLVLSEPAGAQPSPGISEFGEGATPSTYTNFTVQPVAPNPGGNTYVGNVTAVMSLDGKPEVFAMGSNGHLYRFVQGPTASWQPPVDLTQNTSGAPDIDTSPQAILDGPHVSVFALAQGSGDLVDYEDNGAGGTWTVSDLNTLTGSALKFASFTALDIPTWASFVFGDTSSGQLVEVVDDHLFGNVWNSYDISSTSSFISVTDVPSVVTSGIRLAFGTGTAFHIYLRGKDTDHLIEYTDDHLWGNVWNAYDQTKNSGGPSISGHPSALTWNLTPHVYAASTGAALTEFIPDGGGGRLWNAYDQSRASTFAVKASPVALLGTILPAASNSPVPTVIANLTNGELETFIADHANPAYSWSTYDATSSSGGPQPTSDPAAVGGAGQPVYVFALTS